MENRKRSVVKALSWRILATLTTMSIVYFYTREFTLSLGVGAVEVSFKMVLYYGHERLWGRINWGTPFKPTQVYAVEPVPNGNIQEEPVTL